MLLTERYLSNVIRTVINEMFDEAASIPYDPNLLDGIDSIDVRSINLYIKSMIPKGNKMSVNTPYKPIRQLVLYFSSNGAAKHGGRLTKDIVDFMLNNAEFSTKINAISVEDKKIKELIYGPNNLTGKPLMQQIVWHLDEITTQLAEFNAVMGKADYRNYFNQSEAMEGSKDGRRKGLAAILVEAYMATNKIKEQIGKMEKLLAKHNDPFSYGDGKFRR